MTKVRDILKTKSIQGVLSISPSAPVTDAIHLLSEHDVGALLAVDDGMPVGCISERDLIRTARKCSLAELQRKTVADVMTRDVIIGLPDDDVSYIASIMIRNKVRHLPIMHRREIVGLVSIGDVVYSQISDGAFENRMLHDYIEGKYPG